MKGRIKRIGLASIAVLLLIVLVGPFLVPIPPLEGTLPPEALADIDSQFVEVNDLTIHIKVKGEGEPVFLLLHGFGASLYSWRAVMDELAQYGMVIAFDRPPFGLTERPLSWEGENPYSLEAQVELVIGVMNYYDVKEAILIGNSAGGTIAMWTALEYPERVSALILVDPAVYAGGGSPAWMRPLMATPQMKRLGPLLVRQIQERGPDMLVQAWHDPKKLPPETIELYKRPLLVNHWDKALWEFSLASRASDLEDHLAEFDFPILVITGDDDRIVPTEQSIRLAGELPNAKLVVIEEAGHVPHEEQPQVFMREIINFLSTIDEEKPDAYNCTQYICSRFSPG